MLMLYLPYHGKFIAAHSMTAAVVKQETIDSNNLSSIPLWHILFL